MRREGKADDTMWLACNQLHFQQHFVVKAPAAVVCWLGMD